MLTSSTLVVLRASLELQSFEASLSLPHSKFGWILGEPHSALLMPICPLRLDKHGHENVKPDRRSYKVVG